MRVNDRCEEFFVVCKMDPILPAFIEIGEQEQAQEIRTYLKECGAEIAEESVLPLSEEVSHLIDASDVCLKTNTDLEGVMNSILSLVLVITENRETLISKFCDKLVQFDSEDDTLAAGLKVLNTLVNGLHEKDSVRYHVYCAQIKLASKAGLITHIPTNLERVKKWLVDWKADSEKSRKVYRLLHDALQDDSQNEEATKVMVELLRTYTEENAAQAKDDARTCIVKCLARPNLLIMDHLLGLRPVEALKGDPVHELLQIFVSGNISEYVKFYDAHADLITSLGLSHQKNMKKMRILTIMSIGSEKSEVSFEELSKTIDINIEDVESFVIDAVRTKLIKARLDQVQRKVVFSLVAQRTFTTSQWELLRSRLDEWRNNLQAVRGNLHNVVPPLN